MGEGLGSWFSMSQTPAAFHNSYGIELIGLALRSASRERQPRLCASPTKLQETVKTICLLKSPEILGSPTNNNSPC